VHASPHSTNNLSAVGTYVVPQCLRNPNKPSNIKYVFGYWAVQAFQHGALRSSKHGNGDVAAIAPHG
jgi:hypothetical protein